MVKRLFTVSKTFVGHILKGVLKHNTGGRASAISFFVFSSMIPILLLLISGASLLVPETSVEHLFDALLQSYVPHLPTEETLVPRTLRRLTTVHSDVRIIGVFGFLWTAVGGFVALQQILDEIWGIHQRRSFLRQYLTGFIMLGILLLLTIAAALITLVTPVFARIVSGSLFAPGIALIHAIATIAFPIILLVTCFFIYRVLPSHTPQLLPTVVGALFATLAIYLCRSLFVIYTHHLGNYQMIYGALTFIMLLTFWIYISCIILLLGVEVSAAIEHMRSR